MLVLSRKVNERIVITTPEGRMIEIIVTENDRGKVRLGFLADREVSIDRAEIKLRKEVNG